MVGERSIDRMVVMNYALIRNLLSSSVLWSVVLFIVIGSITLVPPVQAEKVPHIVPVPYTLEEYWDEQRYYYPEPIVRYAKEFANKGMPCRVKNWARLPVNGVYYDFRALSLIQEFHSWESFDRFLETWKLRFSFRWLALSNSIVVRVARADIEVTLTIYTDEVKVECFGGTITEGDTVTDLIDCCPIHD